MKSVGCLVLVALALAPAAAAPRNPLDAARLETLSGTRARPLFAPSRRPPAPAVAAPLAVEPAPVAAKAEPPQPPPFELVGAVVGERASYALLRQNTTQRVVRLRTGEAAEGWRVGAIGKRSVTLERDGRSDQIALTPSPATSAATPAAEVAEAPAAGEPPRQGLRRPATRNRN